MVLKSICFDCHCRHSIILSFYFIFSSLLFVLLLIYKAEFPKRDKYICKSYRAEKHISMTFCGDWGDEKWRKGDSKQMCSGESSLQQLHIKTMKRKLFERHIYLLHNIISYTSMNRFDFKCPEVGFCVSWQKRGELWWQKPQSKL